MRDASRPDGRIVGELRVPKASEALADSLRTAILEGDLPAGSPLASERELVDQTKLSRTAVREALRILETEGLVSVRPGRGGGTFVRRPDAAVITRSLDSFIRSHRIRFESLIEIRESVEPICAGFAAERRTDDDLKLLRDLNEECRSTSRDGDVPVFLTDNVKWHVAVAAASHNELLVSFMEAISEAIRAATDIADFNSDEIRARAIRAHDKVNAAIADGDAEVARRRMQRHVSAYREELSQRAVPEELALDAKPAEPDTEPAEEDTEPAEEERS
ncbi:MAG: FCD domain-containing protein [Solirubrobacterales bacterium]|nr:FCD domain-containing protein [Solirubrobacterales bacterium]